MFTGIVLSTGEIISIEPQKDGLRLCIESAFIAGRAKLGSSVSVSGVCLTVSKKEGKKLWFDVMEETVTKTTLAKKRMGDRVNLEPSLRLGDEVGGHFVYGHTDTVGEIKEIITAKAGSRPYGGTKLRNSRLLRTGLTKKFMKYIAAQGSVTIDGVSLTVARVGKSDFTVSLVEYTLEHTTLKFLKKGDRVNVECDMIAKYV